MSVRPRAIISDHALIRWLERRQGFPMDVSREGAAREVEPFTGCGCKGVVVEGLQWILGGHRATTVLHPGYGTSHAAIIIAPTKTIHDAPVNIR